MTNRKPRWILGLVMAATSGLAFAQNPQIRIVAPRASDAPTSVSGVQALVRGSDGEIASVTAVVNGVDLGALTAPPYQWVLPGTLNASALSVRVTATDEHGHEDFAEVLVLGEDVSTFSSDTRAVTINIGVFDRRRRPVLDLRQEELVIRDNGQPQEILQFGRDEVPLRALVLLDRSDSMRGRLDAARRALNQFLGSLDARDQVKLVAFNDRVLDQTDFTANHGEVRARAGELEAAGGTALLDAILFALEHFDEVSETPTRPAMLVLSDGWDRDSVNPMNRVIERAREVGATVFAVGHGEALDSNDLRDTLRAMARATGGEAYFERRSDRLGPIFAEVARRMRAMYFVSFIPQSRSAGWHELKVDVPDRRVELRHKLGYLSRVDGRD